MNSKVLNKYKNSSGLTHNRERVFYKVCYCHEETGKLFSTNQAYGSPLSVEYKRHGWTTPNIDGSKLFVFGRKNDAFAYAEANKCELKIFSCIVKNPVRMKTTAICSVFAPDMEAAKKYWEHQFLNEYSQDEKHSQELKTIIVDNTKDTNIVLEDISFERVYWVDKLSLLEDITPRHFR